MSKLQKNASESVQQIKRQSNLETANQMFVDAWLIIQTRIQKQHPELNIEQVKLKTAEYFRNLKD